MGTLGHTAAQAYCLQNISSKMCGKEVKKAHPFNSERFSVLQFYLIHKHVYYQICVLLCYIDLHLARTLSGMR